MLRDEARHQARQEQAGGSLIEVLIVLLMVGLLAAALLSRMMETTAKVESVAAGDAESSTEDLAGLLKLLTSDPENLDPKDLERFQARRPDAGTPAPDQQGLSPGPESSSFETPDFETEADRQAYGRIVDQLEDSGRLGDWKDLLRERLGPDHPLRVLLDPQGEAPTNTARDDARWVDDPHGDDVGMIDDDDPDIRWVD